MSNLIIMYFLNLICIDFLLENRKSSVNTNNRKHSQNFQFTITFVRVIQIRKFFFLTFKLNNYTWKTKKKNYSHELKNLLHLSNINRVQDNPVLPYYIQIFCSKPTLNDCLHSALKVIYMYKQGPWVYAFGFRLNIFF